MKPNTIIVLASLFLTSCTSSELVSTEPAEPSAASPTGASSETVASADIPVVQVDLAQASGPSDIVCTKIVRPGTRIVVGEKCAPAGAATGVNAQTREEIQREISGQGWSSGWKTEDQIAAERRTMLGR